jgi:hypothetical protein
MKKCIFRIIFPVILIAFAAKGYSQPSLSKVYPLMYSVKPVSILVMPVINRSGKQINTGNIKSNHEICLAEKGYYVMPYNVIENSIIADSLECLPDIDPAPCRAFHDRFGADAMLYIAVKSWEKDYSESILVEELEYSLVSAIDGRELWYYDRMIVKDNEFPAKTTEKTYDFWTTTGCGIFSSIIAGSVATAFSSYRKTAEELYESVFLNLPAGKYNNRYMLDSIDRAKINPLWQKQKFGNRQTAE